MEYGARLWIIEQVVQDDLASTSLGVALLDLNMLICFGVARANGRRIRPPARYNRIYQRDRPRDRHRLAGY
jgi:hypothetical protein